MIGADAAAHCISKLLVECIAVGENLERYPGLVQRVSDIHPELEPAFSSEAHFTFKM